MYDPNSLIKASSLAIFFVIASLMVVAINARRNDKVDLATDFANRGRYDLEYLHRFFQDNASPDQEKNVEMLQKVYDQLLKKLESIPFESEETIRMSEYNIADALNKPISEYPAVRSMLMTLSSLIYIAKPHYNECHEPFVVSMHRKLNDRFFLVDQFVDLRVFRGRPSSAVLGRPLKDYISYFINQYYQRCPDKFPKRLELVMSQLKVDHELRKVVELLNEDGADLSQENFSKAVEEVVKSRYVQPGEPAFDLESTKEKICKTFEKATFPLADMFDAMTEEDIRNYTGYVRWDFIKEYMVLHHICKREFP